MSWVLAILGFCALVVLHEGGHFTAAKMVGMRVERFFLFFPPKLFSARRGETEYGIGAIPLGGYVKITGMNPEEQIDDPEVAERAYYRQPVWKRIFVIGAGPAVNIVLALVIFFILATGFGLDGKVTNTVGEVSSSLPASGVLQSGDKIIAVDGKNVSDLQGIRLANRVGSLINEHGCAGKRTNGCKATEPVQLTIERDGQQQTVAITPVYNIPTKAAAKAGVEPAMRVGFSYEPERVHEGILDAASFSLDRSWYVISQTADRMTSIFNSEDRAKLHGIVGATSVTEQSFQFDVRQAIGILGVISLSLGLINLLPFLPLDGGHIFWSLYEKVRGKRASLRTMEAASFVGFALVLMLFFITLNNDIGKIADGGFHVR